MTSQARALRFLFVCRGSASDGLGHVVRTRAVIEALPRGAVAELVVIGDTLAAGLLQGLPIEWTLVEDERLVAPRARALAPDIVVLDLLSLEAAVFDELGAGTVTVSLSPIFSFLDKVDLAFSRTSYAVDGAPDAPNRRYGLEYAIVRQECERIDPGVFRQQLREDHLAIAISMGGADAPNRTLKVIEGLHGLRVPATFWVLLGEGYGHSYGELVQAVTRDERHEVILAKTNRSMWRILRNCSLAILAGGVTTYEAAYAGLPSISVLEREEDFFLVRELVERGAGLYGGTLDPGGLRQVRESIEMLEQHRDSLFEMHLNGRTLLDRSGADRVVAEMVTYAVKAADARQTDFVARSTP